MCWNSHCLIVCWNRYKYSPSHILNQLINWTFRKTLNRLLSWLQEIRWQRKSRTLDPVRYFFPFFFLFGFLRIYINNLQRFTRLLQPGMYEGRLRLWKMHMDKNIYIQALNMRGAEKFQAREEWCASLSQLQRRFTLRAQHAVLASESELICFSSKIGQLQRQYDCRWKLFWKITLPRTLLISYYRSNITQSRR